MEFLRQDLKQAARSLARTPGFTSIAVITLALGIGANSAIFSLVNAVILAPLPFADPGRLVVVHERRGESHGLNVDAHEFAAMRDEGTRVLESAALYGYAAFNLTGAGEPATVSALTVTAGFFDVLGVRPMLGRTFQPGEDASGAERRVVLSHRFWRGPLGGDSAVVGRDITLDDRGVRVIGVAAPAGDFDPDIWVPMDFPGEVVKVGKHTFTAIARLKPGVRLEQAQSELQAVARRLEERDPGFNATHGIDVVPMKQDVVADARRPVLVALAAVGFVLLIACANVAHLLLTRGTGRRQEIAVRAALGARRGRLVAFLLTESMLLSLMGGALGLLLAAWIADLLPAIRAVRIPRMGETRIDAVVAVTTLGIAMLTGVLSGLVPALRASRPDLRSWLADGGRTSARAGRIADLLVASEIALALVLLVGAGLMVKSFARLTRVDPGFDPQGVLLLRLALPGTRYATPHAQAAAYERLLERLAAVPVVRSAGATTEAPLHACCDTYGVTIENQPAPPPGQENPAMFHAASPGYFQTMRIPLRRGRQLEATDARVALPLIRWWAQQPPPPRFDESQAAPVSVINEAMARRYWPDQDAVGRRFRILFSPWVTVVGVVGDVRHSGLSRDAVPEMFVPYSQEPRGVMSIVMRTDGDPMAVAAAVREQVRAFDPDLPLGELVAMDQVVHDSVGGPRFTTLLLGSLALLALVLALVGIYGVISYAVAQRTHEIGVRTALGAGAGDVLRLVMGRFMVLTAVGLAAGLLGALALTRLLGTLLFDVRPTDPGTFVTITLLLAGVAALASYLPTRRAMRIDPVAALRAQ